jgi:hypothetical protein
LQPSPDPPPPAFFFSQDCTFFKSNISQTTALPHPSKHSLPLKTPTTSSLRPRKVAPFPFSRGELIPFYCGSALAKNRKVGSSGNEKAEVSNKTCCKTQKGRASIVRVTLLHFISIYHSSIRTRSDCWKFLSRAHRVLVETHRALRDYQQSLRHEFGVPFGSKETGEGVWRGRGGDGLLRGHFTRGESI